MEKHYLYRVWFYPSRIAKSFCSTDQNNQLIGYNYTLTCSSVCVSISQPCFSLTGCRGGFSKVEGVSRDTASLEIITIIHIYITQRIYWVKWQVALLVWSFISTNKVVWSNLHSLNLTFYTQPHFRKVGLLFWSFLCFFPFIVLSHQ